MNVPEYQFLYIQRIYTAYKIAIIISKHTYPTQTDPFLKTTMETIETITALSVVIGGLLIIILTIMVGIGARCVVKRKKQKKTTEDDHPEDPHPPVQHETHDIDYEVPNHEPIMNSVTTSHDIDYETPNDNNYESVMNSVTTNPAYGVQISANVGISVDTNIAYGLIESEQDEELTTVRTQQEALYL